ncbi:MAG: ATP-binding cassette domain-containing protein, partial [Planctomycetota bacterium]
MPILTATNVSHHFGQRMILDKLSLTIEPGQRLGIVGRNGCGKSTFLKIMAGIMKCDTGSIALQRGSRVGYLHQDFTLDPTDTLRGAAEAAFEGLHDLHKQLNDVYHHMGDEGADIDKLLKKQAQLETEIEAAGGYEVDHKIDAVLHGLGFVDSQFEVPVTGLSGGQKGRVSLAKLLLTEPDV